MKSFRQLDQCTHDMATSTYAQLWHHITNGCPGHFYKFDIRKIDGIPVWIELENVGDYTSPDKVVHKRLTFIIHLSGEYHDCHLYHKLVSSIEELEHVLTRTYVFNKYHGLFEDEENPIPNFDHLFKGSSMVSRADVCCCCHDLTKSTPKCGHHICYQCKTKLTTKICPICREKLVIDGDADEAPSDEDDE